MITHLAHVNVNVSDIHRSVAFYERLGFQVMHAFGGALERGMAFRDGWLKGAVMTLGDSARAATKLELVQWVEPALETAETKGQYATGVSRLALRTKNLADFAASLARQGVTFEQPPEDIDILGASRFALLRDPDGVLVELLELSA